MARPFDIVGVGSPLVDMIAHVPESYMSSVPGAKGGMELLDAAALDALVASVPVELLRAPGGSSANTIVGMARLGASASFIGKVGTDPSGKFYLSSATQQNVDTSYIRTSDSVPTGACLSLVTPDSERTCRTNLGAAMTLAPDELSAADFISARHAHIEGYVLFNRDLARHVLELAKSAGCSVSLDLASFEVVEANRDVLDELLDEYVDVVFANEDEARAHCGSNDPQVALDTLAEHCRVVAVKLGPEGALLRAGSESTRAGADRVQAIDTTGAGDLWAAGFLYGWLNGWDLSRAGALGAKLGAAVVQQSGAVISDSKWNNIGARLDE